MGHFFPVLQNNAHESKKFGNVCLSTVTAEKIAKGNLSCRSEIYILT